MRKKSRKILLIMILIILFSMQLIVSKATEIQNEKDVNIFSVSNESSTVEVYGTTSIVAKKGDTIDLSDRSNALWRTFARIKDAEILSTEVSKITSTGNTSSTNTAKFIYGNGTQVIVYESGTITYTIKNYNGTVLGTEEVPIKVEANNRKIQRTIYTLSDVSNITNIGQNKAYGKDRQNIGIYLPAGVELKVKQINKNYTDSLSIVYLNDDKNKESFSNDYLIRAFSDVSLGTLKNTNTNISTYNEEYTLKNQIEAQIYSVDKINETLANQEKDTITEEQLTNTITNNYINTGVSCEYNAESRTITGSYTSVPFVQTPYNTTENPILEIDLSDEYFDTTSSSNKKAGKLLYYQYKDNEDNFLTNWKNSEDELALIENKRIIMLVPRCDINILTLDTTKYDDEEIISILSDKKTKECKFAITNEDGAVFDKNGVLIALNASTYWNAHYNDGTFIYRNHRYYTLTYNSDGTKIDGREDYIEENGKYYYLLKDENNNLYDAQGNKINGYNVLKSNVKKYQCFNAIDEMLEYYGDMLDKFDEWVGLKLNSENSINNNILTRFCIKANINGDGYAYVGRNEVGMTSYSIYEYLIKSWTISHELGHTYEGSYRYGQVQLIDVINNIFAYYYLMKYVAIDSSGNKIEPIWLYNGNNDLYDIENNKRTELFDTILNKIRINLKGRELEYIYSETNTYNYPDDLIEGISDIHGLDSFHLRLYIFVNLFDKLGFKESLNNMYTSARNLAAEDKNYNKDENWQANTMAKAFGDNYNVIPYFDTWGFFTDNSVKTEIYSNDKEILWFLAEIVGEENAESVRLYLNNNLTNEEKNKDIIYEGIYSLVSNTDISNYYKSKNTAIPKGTVKIDIKDSIVKKVRLKSGNKIISEIDVSGSSSITKEVEIGAYEIELSVDGENYYDTNKFVISSLGTSTNKTAEINNDDINIPVTVIKYTLTIEGKSDSEITLSNKNDITAKIECSESLINIAKYRVEIYTNDGTMDDTETLSSETNEIRIPAIYLWGDIEITGYALNSKNKVIGTTNVINITLNSPPTLGTLENKTVIEGKNATFKVSITKAGNPAEYTYQWYVNDTNNATGGTAIEGATSSSYTVKGTNDLNGKYYYCIVKNGVCETVTNAAKLTVTADTKGPTITNAVLSSNEWANGNKTITITATATDEQSGVVGYGISNSKETAPETWSTTNVIEVSENGTYYAWAKDGKGNTSCYSTAIQSKIDKNKPKISKITVQNYVITVSGITDEESGIAKISVSKESGKYEWKDNTNETYTTDKLSVGTYYIAVMDNAGNIVEQSTEVKEVIVLVNNIKLSQEELTLNSTVKSIELTATVEPENATNKKLKWESSDKTVATVEQNGVVTAVANGTAEIKVTATDGSGVSKTIICTVTEHTNPTQIEIEGKSRIRKDESHTYTVKYTPEDANINKEVIWSINDNKIAEVNSETGEVVGKKAGKAVITARLKNIEGIVVTKEIEVYYESPTTAEPNVTVTTNSIEVENKQTNEYAEIVEIKYGISEDGENWNWQEENIFTELRENKEYKIKTKVKDENGMEIESELVEVKTEELVIGKLLLKKNETEDYEENSWTNSNISYEIVDEKNMTTVKVLNQKGEIVDLEENTIKDNGIYKILLETTDGTNIKTKEYTVKLDKGTAIVTVEEEKSEEKVKFVKIRIEVKDSISGIKSIKINETEIDHNDNGILYEITKNGTYKIEIEDNAGNIVEKTIEISSIVEKDEENKKEDDKQNNGDTANTKLPQTGDCVMILGIIVVVILLSIFAAKIYKKCK